MRVRGQQRADGFWDAWLEFVAEDGRSVLRTEHETLQRTGEDLAFWASGLEPAYLAGATSLTERRPARGPVRVGPRQRSSRPDRGGTGSAGSSVGGEASHGTHGFHRLRAEAHYRAMFRRREGSWDLRDRSAAAGPDTEGRQPWNGTFAVTAAPPSPHPRSSIGTCAIGTLRSWPIRSNWRPRPDRLPRPATRPLAAARSVASTVSGPGTLRARMAP